MEENGIITEPVITKQIEDFKKTHVPREEFDKVAKEREELLEALMKGKTAEPEPAPAEPVMTEADYKKYFKETKHDTNLNYISNVLKFRETVLANGGLDIFEAQNDNIIDGARVASKLKEIVEKSNGNPELFLNMFQAHVRDLQLKPSKR